MFGSTRKENKKEKQKKKISDKKLKKIFKVNKLFLYVYLNSFNLFSPK